MRQLEANIVINGHTLTPAQSLTVRVACSNFNMELGDNERGRNIAQGFQDRLNEVLTFIAGE